MESDNFQNDRISSLNSSKDTFRELSDLKKMLLLRYSNRDLYLLNLKNDLIKNGKTLFYPYCCRNEDLDCLNTLDNTNIILADGLLKYSSKISSNGRNRVISIDLDPVMVILMMLELNIKIDCFLGIKDDYHPDDFGFLLDLAIPLFNNKLIYVSQRSIKVGPFRVIENYIKRLPFKSKIYIESDYFQFFTDKDLNDVCKIFGTNFNVVLLENTSNRCKVSLINGKRVNLIQDSIWRYVDMLDLSFIEYDNDNTFQQEIINQNYDNIFNVRGKYESDDGLELDLYEEFDIQVVINMHKSKSKTVGFTHNWKNQEQIKLLLEPNNGLRDIYIFCPDKEQFMELYFIHWEDVIDDDL